MGLFTILASKFIRTNNAVLDAIIASTIITIVIVWAFLIANILIKREPKLYYIGIKIYPDRHFVQIFEVVQVAQLLATGHFVQTINDIIIINTCLILKIS